mgnify:CR=1 FL=1
MGGNGQGMTGMSFVPWWQHFAFVNPIGLNSQVPFILLLSLSTIWRNAYRHWVSREDRPPSRFRAACSSPPQCWTWLHSFWWMRGDPFARQKNPNRGDLRSSEFGLRGVVFSTFIPFVILWDVNVFLVVSMPNMTSYHSICFMLCNSLWELRGCRDAIQEVVFSPWYYDIIIPLFLLVKETMFGNSLEILRKYVVVVFYQSFPFIDNVLLEMEAGWVLGFADTH